MEHRYMCVVYLPDGKTVAQCEGFDTAIQAVMRARKWRKLGHIANAYCNELNLDTLELISHVLY